MKSLRIVSVSLLLACAPFPCVAQPTPVAGAAAGGSMGAAAPRAALHLEGHVANTACGVSLELSLTIQNRSAVPFAGLGVARVSGEALAKDPKAREGVQVAFAPVPANGQKTLTVKVGSLRVDCVMAQTFLVTLIDPGTQGALAAWDRVALELSTAPPANCRAATSSRRYTWDPRL